MSMTLHPAAQHPVRRRPGRRPHIKDAAIIEVAMRHFARRGYEGARVEEMAEELRIAKGSIFHHFKSKERLFLEVYKEAARALGRYLGVPDALKQRGFFAIVRYWLEQTQPVARRIWIPWQILTIGNFGTSLWLRQQIRRYMVQEDPAGVGEFVRYGVERGEVRADVEPELIAWLLDWLVERYQDDLLTEDRLPGAPKVKRGRALKLPERLDQTMAIIEAAFRAGGSQ
jgi:AcrR family transcriptional regulator